MSARTVARLACALVLAAAGCDGRTEGGKPVNTPPAEAKAPAEPPAPAKAPEAPLPLGWWRGENVCLELLTSGDFELSVLDEPKVLVYGSAQLAASGPEGLTLALTVAKIWKGRYVSRCRKHHETGHFVDEQDVLGVRFTPGATATLTLRRTSADAVELCGTRCETLQKAEQVLGARWRRVGFDDPMKPSTPFAAGDLLELDVRDHGAHLWLGLAGDRHATAYGEMKVAALGDDRFTVTLTTRFFADLPEGATATLFGAPIAVEAPRTLTARRLADQKLEVCDGERCATLERQFDAHDYDLR